VTEALGARDLEKVLTFAEFVRARRASRGFTRQEGTADEPSKTAAVEDPADYEPPSSQQRTASRGG
jgi:hypothetical protein